MSSNDDSRTQGVEFGSLADDLEAEEYPLDTDELLDEYGPHQIELGEDSESLQEILGQVGETTYDSAEEVMDTIVSMVSDDAIGREGYSDRGEELNEEQREEESI
ncbi:DUF5789 family protein [Halobacteriaceae archaeon SHR40]|uniref:DUF5789 family protein n=1 Tax=Halovenus amylolytica TaxID=2500550 RepID=UPI000FE2A4AB